MALTKLLPERRPAAIADANLAWNRTFWAKYDWPRDGDEWSAAFGGTEALWHGMILPRLRAFLPCRHLLEIAPGHGRCTQFLRPSAGLCERLTIVDLVPQCIEVCRRRFGGETKIAYEVNDGRSLGMVAEASVDLAFSWDSLVHVEHETMRAYVGELARVLRPGGYAFLHHSNLGAYAVDQLAGLDPGKDLHGRGRTMSAAKLRDDCTAAGLRCLSQELVPWGSIGLWMDTFSLMVRDDGQRRGETAIVERRDWGAEIENTRRNARLYRRTKVG